MGLNADFPTLNPGDFRHQILLLEPVTTIGEAGSVTSYQPGHPRVAAWAKIEFLRGDEIIKSGVDASQSFIKVVTWWRPEFTVKSRILTPSGQHFIIQTIENVKSMNTYMVMMCLSVGAC
jgi:head-tail adaptor